MGYLLDAYESALKSSRRAGSLKIRGAGVASGGCYREVIVSGAGRVEGDVEADFIKISGSATFNGSITAREVRVSGAMKVQGSLKAVLLHAAGAMRVEGIIEAEDVEFSGSLIASEINSKRIVVNGAFKTLGRVSGREVTFILSGDSKAEAIEADLLKVKGYTLPMLLRLILRKTLPALDAREIHAREVILENVIIRGTLHAEKVKVRGGVRVEGEVIGKIVKEE
ncbi:polymer-forming cytoskeletal protein [Infirmifilum lucidum]|uniref:Polymer-forming cytoskeletal protein n=1 Tax=Infirmifilum lucidum TaxID=2776706 RepID=A0A7L9FKH2_9CREN|nr:polymer-forming cytoskeletal protein [Infirmifilum lucidum]QOJ79513.1 polymer-forming cytoskeletal protein [Infirmifilum lucidum]